MITQAISSKGDRAGAVHGKVGFLPQIPVDDDPSAEFRKQAIDHRILILFLVELDGFLRSQAFQLLNASSRSIECIRLRSRQLIRSW